MRARDLATAAAVAAVGGVLCFGNPSFLLYFPNHAFGDQGWAVRADGLLDDGLVPTRDFGYTYGLLALAVNRGVFAVAGATPFATAALIAACAAATAAGVWRVCRCGGFGWLASAAAVFTLPLVVNPAHVPSPVHALEAALLVHAVAFHLRGRVGAALALATVAVTVKPALGYVYGFALVAQVLTSPDPDGRNRLRRLRPAAAVGLPLLAALAARFGVEAVWNTQSARGARAEYDNLGCGFFFGIGRPFWDPPDGRTLEYFLTEPAGVWFVCTLALVTGAVAALPRWRADPAAPVVTALAGWHLAFVFFFYGNSGAWIYYPYVPFLGAAVVLDRLPRWRGRAGRATAVALAAAAGLAGAVPAWEYFAPYLGPTCGTPDPVTADLYSYDDEVEGWGHVRRLAATDGVFVLTRMGSPAQLTPGASSPRSWYLGQAIAPPAELQAVRDGVSACRWLLVPHFQANNLQHWPEFADVLKPFRWEQPAREFRWYKLYSR